MQRSVLFLYIISILISSYRAAGPSGTVQLDDISFHKVVPKFKAALVKFDVAFPYGEKHDAFVALGEDARDVDDLLIAEVCVKDYGDRDNEMLAERFGATKDKFPLVKLIIKGKAEPLTFDDSKGFTSDELRKFIRVNTGIYMNLPGCIQELDMLAMKFIKAKPENRIDILKETTHTIEKLETRAINSGKIYTSIMEKILEKGDEFVDAEHERVKKILAGKLSDEKKNELNAKLNILQSFHVYEEPVIEKDEL